MNAKALRILLVARYLIDTQQLQCTGSCNKHTEQHQRLTTCGNHRNNSDSLVDFQNPSHQTSVALSTPYGVLPPLIPDVVAAYWFVGIENAS